jgi:hypothetical protein
MIWLLPPSPVSKLSLFLGLPVCRRSSLLTGEGEEEEPNQRNHGYKAWPSINHSILSDNKQGLEKMLLLEQSDVTACKPDQVLVDKQLSGCREQ